MSSVSIDIERAERGGIISAEQASALRKASAPPHDEPVRVTGRFSTVFVAIGCAILVYGIFTATKGFGVPALYGRIVQIVGAVLLAEAVNRHRMAFATGACVLLAAWTTAHAVALIVYPSFGSLLIRRSDYADSMQDVAIVLSSMALVTGLGLARFRIPFLILPTVGFAAVGLAHYLLANNAITSPYALTAIGIVGACLLATGVWADGRDGERKTKLGQYAFWLFMAGSPLTVHPFIILVLTQIKGLPASIMALMVITIAGLVTLGGLRLNRRAPVVSTLLYVTVAVGYLLESAGVAMVLIGAYVVCLGILWEPARRALGLPPAPGVA